ncbi:hypothetical protein [Actinokineospora terrae]|uniref:Uncharacterized protein n=1 Tax=Actinokineospora terrae TaxID=155974 RepID=A0A1H9MWG8_9PSEU|nr:hypothetical protein [Actinokineospora terrae]SER28042.1 hypothetical protein SAMN04487818_102377 [Actinokineospora terrae]
MTDTPATGPVLSTPPPADPLPPTAAELPIPLSVRAARDGSQAAGVLLLVVLLVLLVLLVLWLRGSPPVAPLSPTAADLVLPAVAMLVAAGFLLAAAAAAPRTWFPRRRVSPATLC